VTRAELLDFISSRHHAIVITTRADGTPQASPVTCGVDDGKIVVATYPERAKTRNARRNPQLSVLVLSGRIPAGHGAAGQGAAADHPRALGSGGHRRFPAPAGLGQPPAVVGPYNVEQGWQTGRMTGSDPKADLHRYLQDAREALLWKLDGLSEYDIRRPMVPTGTNLLGLIKHVASVELGYFGDSFGRPFAERLPWLENDAEPNADMWATAAESREQITGLYQRAWAHSDATISTLALDAVGHVPWWPQNRSEVTLHKILVHMIAETDRHAGQADIVRELIDGATGLRNSKDNMAQGDQAWWESYRDRLERVALEAQRGATREAG
jgi:PPOX class probable F420-dependent enzyme